jgi:hypothetical protein
VAGFILPQPLVGMSSPASGWTVADWLDKSYASPPAVGGVATLSLPQVEPGRLLRLTHAVVSCTSAATTQLRLYLDTVAPGSLRDGSIAGNFDVADWPGGLLVPTSRVLVAQWTGATDGAVGTLTLQGEVLLQAGS